MRIIVCAKQVPDTNEVKIDPVTVSYTHLFLKGIVAVAVTYKGNLLSGYLKGLFCLRGDDKAPLCQMCIRDRLNFIPSEIIFFIGPTSPLPQYLSLIHILRFSKHIASAADTKPSQVSPMTGFRTRGVASALTAAVPSMIYTWFPILPVKCDLSQSTRSI